MDRDLAVRHSPRMDTIGLGLTFQHQCLVCLCFEMLFAIPIYFAFLYFLLILFVFVKLVDVAVEREVEGDLLLGDMGQVYILFT